MHLPRFSELTSFSNGKRRTVVSKLSLFRRCACFDSQDYNLAHENPNMAGGNNFGILRRQRIFPKCGCGAAE
jgi:hypothetical protein